MISNLKIKDMNANLLTNDGDKVFALKDIQIKSGLAQFFLKFQNEKFSGESTYTFEVFTDQILHFTGNLERMIDANDIQEVTLNDLESDDFVRIEKLDSLGHFRLTTRIGGGQNLCHLDASFDFDQTALPDFLRGIRKAISVAQEDECM